MRGNDYPKSTRKAIREVFFLGGYLEFCLTVGLVLCRDVRDVINPQPPNHVILSMPSWLKGPKAGA
jgi:hypothetical protein